MLHMGGFFRDARDTILWRDQAASSATVVGKCLDGVFVAEQPSRSSNCIKSHRDNTSLLYIEHAALVVTPLLCIKSIVVKNKV